MASIPEWIFGKPFLPCDFGEVIIYIDHLSSSALAYTFGPSLMRPQQENMDTMMKGPKMVNAIVQHLLENKERITVLFICILVIAW